MSFTPYGMFYFAWHRHQIEGTNLSSEGNVHCGVNELVLIYSLLINYIADFPSISLKLIANVSAFICS